ncbi:hypothetical protein PVAP13_8NG178303 [Panicum virgatum]|uniref:Uncharacterized protein n=1 Tax=Panicum virgatum TaxID=38727 RepID=A0A8T0PDB3_PANVG|nr:hypothetical protein PVAP13_8NG178303 [Panicum virgatum]
MSRHTWHFYTRMKFFNLPPMLWSVTFIFAAIILRLRKSNFVLKRNKVTFVLKRHHDCGQAGFFLIRWTSWFEASRQDQFLETVLAAYLKFLFPRRRQTTELFIEKEKTTVQPNRSDGSWRSRADPAFQAELLCWQVQLVCGMTCLTCTTLFILCR